MKVLKELLKNPLSLTGLVLVAVFAVIAIAAPLIAPPVDPQDPYKIPRDGFLAEPSPPGEGHPFGTSEGQYDIFYGVIWGARTAFRVGLTVTGAALVIGMTVGTLAGYYGGTVDELLMRVVEVFQAFPFLLAAITLAAVLMPRIGKGLVVGMIALIAFSWTGYARLIRSDILSVKEREYVAAAKAVGAGDLRIIFRHVLPNCIFPTLVMASMDIGSYVLTFSFLSFLGLGAEKGYADWGQLISFARNWIPVLSKYWYIMVYPGTAIVLFVLGWNLLGDAFRDILDPRMRGARG
jgi:peptide/nickel transport system permease protein